MLSPALAKVATGVLMFANRLAAEKYNGRPLRELYDERQLELVAEAAWRLNRYKEQ